MGLGQRTLAGRFDDSMKLTLELRAVIYQELVQAAKQITPECTSERFAALVIESEMASRRLEKMERPRVGGHRIARLHNTGLRLGAPLP
jgi:hypothetical protein